MQVIVQKRGAKLAVQNGMFAVKAGEQEQLIPVSTVRSIVLGPSTSITYDAMELAIREDCDIVLQSRSGQPIGRVWSNRFGSIAGIRRKQLAFSRSPGASDWIRESLQERITTMQAILMVCSHLAGKSSADIETILQNLDKISNVMNGLPKEPQAEFFASIRGWEGQAAKSYFRGLSGCLPDLYKFQKRSQHPAKDAFNALLNYGYGMLYARIEWALIQAGLDPFIGIMHRDEYNKAVLSYDVIERYRSWVEFPVIQLCFQQLVLPEFFKIEQGSWWLEDDIKRILARSINDYLEEVVDLNGQQRSRLTHIQNQCYQFASLIKKYEESL